MERNKARNTQIVYGICTNTGGKKDGTACSKCQNKEKQAIRASKEFICEECGEPLTKVDPPHPKPPKWLFVVLALVVIGGCVGAYLGLFKGSEKTNEPVSLSLNKEKISLYVGESDTLKATVYSQPEDANVSVFFASDNVKVARVDNNGVVYAVSKGEANITVIAQMEIGVSDTAQAKVTVKDAVKDEPPVDISINTNTKPVTEVSRHGWFTWNGNLLDGKPHGKGTMKVTQTHTIELVDITGSKITVSPGETIEAMFDRGQLRGGDIIHKDGSSTTFVNNI